MSRFFNILKNVVFFAVIAAGAYFAFNYFYFLDKFPFVSPLDKNLKLSLRSDAYGQGYFGARRAGGRRHNGIDFSAPIGTNVRAVKGGWVVAARQSRGLGKYVEIFHGDGLISLYGHLDSIKVSVLERVVQGQVIGTVGKTGNANYKRMTPHLHLELIRNGQAVDPVK